MSKEKENTTPPKGKKVVAAVDIGTTKIEFAIGVATSHGIDVVGVGQVPNPGMRQGVVVNIEAATEAIIKAKEEAELMSGLSASSAWISVGGAHIESFDSQGMVAISDKEVTPDDVSRVIEAARAVAIPTDRQVLHILPNDFRIDKQEGISDPIGMSGVRLECSVHIVTGNRAAMQNTERCLEKAGIKVNGLVLQQLASALAVLSDDEKNMGVTVVDIGGGTCDLISYVGGSVVHTAVIPVGGNNFTHDVAMGLRTTQVNAESLKKKFGHAIAESIDADQTVEVEGVGGREARTVSRKELCSVLEARTEETLSLVRGELADHNLVAKLGSGIVLTGGASQLEGILELGDFIFDVPVRRGVPQKTGGLTDVVKCTSHASAVGLLLYGWERVKHHKVDLVSNSPQWSDKFKTWSHKVRDYLGGAL